MSLFDGTYENRRVLVTGHTGFKGSWLALWLTQLGAKVTGASLAPSTKPNHWDLLELDIDDKRVDIRNAEAVAQLVEEARPEIVFHLAAQPLVRHSYKLPMETWSSNVMGTCHVLDACCKTPGVQAIVCVTTDKCYENKEWLWGYRENDRLGGRDPYSASKAAAELVAASYRASFMSADDMPLLATARAGNVIGGADWSQDRLVPDLVRAVSAGISLEIRSPHATRPWQHVLESLSGYLLLGQKLLSGDRSFAEAWNFGPDVAGNRSVFDVLTRLTDFWPDAKWHKTQQVQPHEAALLSLDSTKARSLLGWQAVWGLDDALIQTVEWYQAWLQAGDVISIKQIERYIDAATSAGVTWSRT